MISMTIHSFHPSSLPPVFLLNTCFHRPKSSSLILWDYSKAYVLILSQGPWSHSLTFLSSEPLHHLPVYDAPVMCVEVLFSWVWLTCSLKWGLGQWWPLANVDLQQFGWHTFQQSALIINVFLIICPQNMAFILPAQGIPYNMCMPLQTCECTYVF